MRTFAETDSQSRLASVAAAWDEVTQMRANQQDGAYFKGPSESSTASKTRLAVAEKDFKLITSMQRDSVNKKHKSLLL